MASVVPIAAVLALSAVPAAAGGSSECAPEATWQRAADALGLLVIEPERHLVGEVPGSTKTWPLANDILDVGDNWFPLDVERKAFCGRADRWSMFEHPASGHEHDLHAHIVPSHLDRVLADLGPARRAEIEKGQAPQ